MYLYTKPDKSIEYAKQGLALSEKFEYKEGQSICLNVLGRAYRRLGKLDTAMICYEKRYKVVRELKDSIGIAAVYLNMGIIFSDNGDNKKAIGLYEKANRIYSSRNEKSLLAKGYNNIGSIYQSQDEYPIALEYFLKACKIYEDEKNDRDICNPLINICNIYMHLKQYHEAKKYALYAKERAAKVNNFEGVGTALQRLAVVYGKEGDFENMVKYLKEAKAIFDETKSIYSQIIVTHDLGVAYSEHGEYEKALGYFHSALPIAQKMGEPRLISSLYENIGVMYLDKGDFLKALEYIRKSEKICIELNNKRLLLDISINFIDLFSRTNQPDSISKYFKRYQQLSDTIFNEQNTKAIAEMQTKYETEKKDKEILVLNLEAEKKKNTIWAIAAGSGFLLVILLSGFVVFRNKKKREQAVLLQMVSENNMRALRSQMNPHFIFNCVHTVEGLLDDFKINESKIFLEKFSGLTRSVLENSKKKEISLAEEIDTLRLYMDIENLRFRIPFRYEIIIEPDIDIESTLISPLILQPFVENSIKHGFRDTRKSGHLKIEIRIENGFLLCSVEDDGIGRMSLNIKTVSGFKKESLGIKLTEERLELISRTKKIKSYYLIDDLIDAFNKPAGTRVRLFLPYELSV
ncbi:MAG TPA: tetratricopeptide repeat protein [Prolixibacteraceae bacterium]